MHDRKRKYIPLFVKICHHLTRGKQNSIELAEKKDSKIYTKLKNPDK